MPEGSWRSETTDLSCHLSQKRDLRATTERRPQYRGARTEVIGKISDTANSAVAFRRGTLEVTGLSYPIGSVPDRLSARHAPKNLKM
jgi:hypothetical protein